jgi:hypothetical protein
MKKFSILDTPKKPQATGWLLFFWLVEMTLFQYPVLADNLPNTKKLRSSEWKNLPPQSWEQNSPVLLQNVDRLNFDTRSKTISRVTTSTKTQWIIASHSMDFLGKIVNSLTSERSLVTGDTVLIRSNESIQIGKIYAIVQKDPLKIRSPRSSRTGLLYEILGTLKILGVQENLFVAKIESTQGQIMRESQIIAVPPKLSHITPVAGPEPIRGFVINNPTNSGNTLSQFTQVFIDRGSEDSIQTGMIFRIYKTKDPFTHQSFTHSSFIIDADLLVTQVSELFSMATVIRCSDSVQPNPEGVLLTSLGDLKTQNAFSIKGTDSLDELDRTDTKDSLGVKESWEVEQLEQWNKSPGSSKNPAVTPALPSSRLSPTEPATKLSLQGVDDDAVNSHLPPAGPVPPSEITAPTLPAQALPAAPNALPPMPERPAEAPLAAPAPLPPPPPPF